MTDTTGMKASFITACAFAVLVVVILMAVPAPAGEAFHCRECGGGAAGMSTPYGDTGCGPRYCGAKHEEPNCPDPCDSCNRWRGCNGVGPGNDLLPPWQLPPGRGFQSAEDVGYDTRRQCQACQDCGHHARAKSWWCWW